MLSNSVKWILIVGCVIIPLIMMIAGGMPASAIFATLVFCVFSMVIYSFVIIGFTRESHPVAVQQTNYVQNTYEDYITHNHIYPNRPGAHGFETITQLTDGSVQTVREVKRWD